MLRRFAPIARNRLAHLPLRPLLAALLAASVVGGCVSSSSQVTPASVATGPAASAPTNFKREQLVGRWGIASFHTEKDRKRTEAEARSQCSQPYTIGLGPHDGVMMHVADDPKLYELKLKAGPGGKIYLGFEAPAGDPQDREILSYSDRIMTLRFVDPDAHRRYGTFIFVRCGAAA